MTEEQYLMVRDLPEIPMEIWYMYYRERGGTMTSFDDFKTAFAAFVWNQATMEGSDGSMKQITLKSAYDNFYRYYNEKFRL